MSEMTLKCRMGGSDGSDMVAITAHAHSAQFIITQV